MITVFHARLYDRFIEIKSNFRRKSTDQGCDFVGGSFRSTDNVRSPTKFRREDRPNKIFFFKKQTNQFSNH